MAKIYGSRSKYLVSQDLWNYGLYAVIFLTPLVGLWMVFAFKTGATLLTDYTGEVIAVLIVMIILEPFLFRLKKTSDKFWRGRLGEYKIKELLEKLPDEFSIFRSIRLGDRGDIDLIVLGPTGLFTLEVKSHRGNIGFDGRFLTKNGRVLEKDFLRQVKAQAVQISDVLLQKLGVKVFVKPILVFANYAKMNFGIHPVGGVFVIGKPFLINLIQSQPKINYQLPIEQIEKALIEITY